MPEAIITRVLSGKALAKCDLSWFEHFAQMCAAWVKRGTSNHGSGRLRYLSLYFRSGCYVAVKV
jgi:hypothetical protein